MELQVTRPDRGFTLIELMVVIVIVTILLSIAIPNYLNYVRQARRSEAKTTLLDLAGREETYFSTNGAAYTTSATALGFAVAWGAPFGSGYYNMQVCEPAASTCFGLPVASAPAAPSYQFVATAIGIQ